MPDVDTVSENLQEIEARIQAAVEKSAREREEVELLVVTKKWSADVVQLAVDAGHTLFGENKVQEAMAKIPELSSNLVWHLIGHLQKNKIRKALPLFSTIHSIDSLELAQQVDRIADEEGKYPDVFLEMNLGEEGSKHGFTEKTMRPALEPLLELGRIQIVGLMAIPPFSADPEETRKYFVKLRELRERLEKEAGILFPQLSMGMSHDYEVAIEEGPRLCGWGRRFLGLGKRVRSRSVVLGKAILTA